MQALPCPWLNGVELREALCSSCPLSASYPSGATLQALWAACGRVAWSLGGLTFPAICVWSNLQNKHGRSAPCCHGCPEPNLKRALLTDPCS